MANIFEKAKIALATARANMDAAKLDADKHKLNLRTCFEMAEDLKLWRAEYNAKQDEHEKAKDKHYAESSKLVDLIHKSDNIQLIDMMKQIEELEENISNDEVNKEENPLFDGNLYGACCLPEEDNNTLNTIIGVFREKCEAALTAAKLKLTALKSIRDDLITRSEFKDQWFALAESKPPLNLTAPIMKSAHKISYYQYMSVARDTKANLKCRTQLFEDALTIYQTIEYYYEAHPGRLGTLLEHYEELMKYNPNAPVTFDNFALIKDAIKLTHKFIMDQDN